MTCYLTCGDTGVHGLLYPAQGDGDAHGMLVFARTAVDLEVVVLVPISCNLKPPGELPWFSNS
eukprot:2029970-Pyramimonas_sp.AAC.1